MKNKKQITQKAQKLNNDVELNANEVQALYDLIKKSDDKETSNTYLNYMVQAKNAKDQYDKLHYINQALFEVKIKPFNF